jgi:hypothetical protein
VGSYTELLTGSSRGAVFIGGVVGGHVFASAGEHNRDATGLKNLKM